MQALVHHSDLHGSTDPWVFFHVRAFLGFRLVADESTH